MLMLMIQMMMNDDIGDNDDDDDDVDGGVDYDAFVEHFTALWLKLDAAARNGLN